MQCHEGVFFTAHMCTEQLHENNQRPKNPVVKVDFSVVYLYSLTQMLHAWNIYLHLP